MNWIPFVLLHARDDGRAVASPGGFRAVPSTARISVIRLPDHFGWIWTMPTHGCFLQDPAHRGTGSLFPFEPGSTWKNTADAESRNAVKRELNRVTAGYARRSHSVVEKGLFSRHCKFSGKACVFTSMIRRS